MAYVLKLTSRDDQNTHYVPADKVVSWTVGGGKDDAYTVLSFVNGRTFNAQGDVSERIAKAVTGEQSGSDEDVSAAKAKNPHYYKSVQRLSHVDVYRVLSLFGVTDPCLQHALKKVLVAGGRSGGKDAAKDVAEAIMSLQRWQEMRAEDERG